MRTAIIIHNIDNLPLLRFTETKLFFDANNQAIDFVDDCVVVDNYDSAMSYASTVSAAVVLYTGDFLTTNFRNRHKHSSNIIVADQDVIKFDPDTYIGVKKRCHYGPGTKQLYIIENFLKMYLRSKTLVYLDNTEQVNDTVPTQAVEHLYGLASGWKTMMLAAKIGFDKLKSITVYDYNQTQLNHARWLHTNPLAAVCPDYKNTCGQFNTDKIDQTVWMEYSQYPVKFEQINLFDLPVFPKHSIIWISNVFRYEPNIFDLGWKMCKNTLDQLKLINKHNHFI